MAYNSAYTGAQVDAAVGAVRNKETTWDGKQNALSGTEDQIVGFNSAGNATPVPKPTASDVGAIPAPDGGEEGQVLTKTSTGQEWRDLPEGLPSGGTEGQVLTKTADGAEWDDVPSDLPAGGTNGQILTKTDDGVAWSDAPDTGVTTFNGRTGAVSPQTGDYTADMVGARPNTWTPSAADVGAVPTDRTVNGKALSQNITLTADDVGARANTWMPTASDVGAVPTTRTVNGKALSADISLMAVDVGARASTWLPTPAEIGAATPAVAKTVTLYSSGWSSNSQTVTVNGVLADETKQLIQPMPAVASQVAYMSAGIYCSGQAANSLTFTCSETPTEDITLYIVITEVGA